MFELGLLLRERRAEGNSRGLDGGGSVTVVFRWSHVVCFPTLNLEEVIYDETGTAVVGVIKLAGRYYISINSW